MATKVGVSASTGGVLIFREITHEKNLVGIEREAHGFVETMADLGERLGPLPEQLPPSFAVEGMGLLEDIIEEPLDGSRRLHYSPWTREGLTKILRGGR